MNVHYPSYLLLIVLIALATAHPVPATTRDTVSAGSDVSGTDLRIARLRLSIWPEYDDPRVLIMFRGELAPGSTFPMHLTLSIPQGAEIIGAGIISAQNELLLSPYRVTPGESHDSLEINLAVSRFFVEFYYDPFVVGANRRFTYTFPATSAIEHLEVDMQQPLQATNFTTDPPSSRQETDRKGFTFHWLLYRNIDRGEVQSFTISYTKTTADPSVVKRQPEPAVVAHSRTAVSPTIMALGLLAGAVVLFGGSAWLWKGYQRRRKVESTGIHTGPSDLVTPTTDVPNFCPNCGRQAQPVYRFCPGCGRPLRHANTQ